MMNTYHVIVVKDNDLKSCDLKYSMDYIIVYKFSCYHLLICLTDSYKM